MNTALNHPDNRDYFHDIRGLSGQSVKWLQTYRKQAREKFLATGFPCRTEEEWRYTNLSILDKKSFKPTTQTAVIDEQLLTSFMLDNTWTMVFIDGYYSAHYSQLDGLDDAITLNNIAHILETQADKLIPYLGQAVSLDEHNFVAFNSAQINDGIFLDIPAHHQASQAIHFLHLVSSPDCLATTRNIIVIGQHAQAQLIETFIGQSSYLTTTVNEVFMAKNSALTLHKFQSEAKTAYHFGGTYVKQQAHSRFTHHNFSFGALLSRHDVHTTLETAAECSLNGLYLAATRQHVDNHTRINHNKPHAISHEFYKGILADRARGVFQGRVKVEKDAQKTDSVMNNRNLLLSNQAEIDTKPQLEIYADDVKCAHGMTIGQLDPQSIFYLQSRGMDIKTAQTILTLAFANEMIEKINLTVFKQLLHSHLSDFSFFKST